MPRDKVVPTCVRLSLLLTVALPAYGAPNSLEIQATGTCPSSDAVQQQLEPLLRRHSVVRSLQGEEGHVAKVYDHGDGYVVLIDGAIRRIPDEARDCEERAQVAAVVVALTLEPAGGEPPPEQELDVEREEVKERPREVESTSSDQQMAARFSVAVGAKAITTFEGFGPDLGPLIGANWYWKSWGLSMTASLFPAQTIQLDAATATLSRYSLDLGFGPALDSSTWRLQGLFGVSLDPLVISSETFGTRQTRVDAGPMASVSLAYQRARVQPYLAIDARWFPRNYELMIEPRGEVGRTPRWYLGATAGIRLGGF